MKKLIIFFAFTLLLLPAGCTNKPETPKDEKTKPKPAPMIYTSSETNLKPASFDILLLKITSQNADSLLDVMRANAASLKGIIDANPDTSNKTIEIKFDHKLTTKEKIISHLDKTGIKFYERK